MFVWIILFRKIIVYYDTDLCSCVNGASAYGAAIWSISRVVCHFIDNYCYFLFVFSSMYQMIMLFHCHSLSIRSGLRSELKC